MMLVAENREKLNDIKSELSQIHQSDFSLRHRFLEVRKILDRTTKILTESETLQFPSLFSRIVFIAQKYKLPHEIERGLHQTRIVGNFLLRNENNLVSEGQYTYAYYSSTNFLSFLTESKLIKYNPTDTIVRKENLWLSKIRVQIVDIDRENFIAICQPIEDPESVISVRCKVDKINTAFDQTFDKLWIGAQLNLINCKVDEKGFYTPSVIVLEPDYLIDASAIAECFQNYGNSHLHYFRRKFEQIGNSHHLLLGNLANFFLDELIYSENPEELQFKDVFLRSFKAMPFEFTACEDISSDIDFRDFMSRAESQFRNIKRVVTEDMPASGFEVQKSVLEPSFFSETYGFQGRLDMLQAESEDGFTRIVELKSGKPPWPQEDTTKIAPNHDAQTTVYRLMIQSVFGKRARDTHAMILYSSSDFKGQNLRLSAPYKEREKEIIDLRNQIIATEYKLYTGDGNTVEEIFNDLFDTDNYDERIPDFFVDRLTEIKKVLLNSSAIERLYFYRFISFVSRELYLLKMGDEAYDSSMSVSALWNTSFIERRDALELVSGLEIEDITESQRDMQICFRRKDSSDFVNFREGEICVVYPRQTDDDTILSNQILKGTVVEITADYVLVRFRYKQHNQHYFENNKYWVIEHDKLDHGYNGMFKSLYTFLQAPQDKKELLLGLRQPISSYEEDSDIMLTKEEKQQQVIEKALRSEDYFLIVGPPGTGKTSIFAKDLIQKFHQNKEANILVIAYTNRAVDELCDAICSAFEDENCTCDKYIRIGSEYSCGTPFRHRLLQNISANSKNRVELKQILHETRIYIGTLASIVGKPEIFGVKKFDVAIIDEASQILEPQIIGILPLFEKFIMIGDHKQLSTITLQNEQKSIITNEELNKIGLFDCRESLFERLFRTAQKNAWTHAYDTLDYHGRMHENIAYLVNENFYDGKLKVATNRQIEKLDLITSNSANEVERLISTRRTLFFDVRNSTDAELSDKINTAEAEKVVEIVVSLYELYRVNNKLFDAETTLGIIAPYRNQIALIKHLLEATNIPELRKIMVDTVERYQGSQRDVIVVSFCFNRAYQMYNFANMNRERTVDRKLNVALTRAREQLFLIGNKQLLQQNSLYARILKKADDNL